MKRRALALVVLLLLGCYAWSTEALAQAPQTPTVEAVDTVGMTVADMERSVQFYSGVLSFEKVSDVEVTGSGYEHLQGVFGLRMRVVRLRLGEEYIELTEYLAPRGRPIPVDSRSHDGWFQHVALAQGHLGFAKGLLVRDPDGHAMRIIEP
jgi:catechol 2,3-dioxygenase-like lactoylglutathione lyase family enzyme